MVSWKVELEIWVRKLGIGLIKILSVSHFLKFYCQLCFSKTASGHIYKIHSIPGRPSDFCHIISPPKIMENISEKIFFENENECRENIVILMCYWWNNDATMTLLWRHSYVFAVRRVIFFENWKSRLLFIKIKLFI